MNWIISIDGLVFCRHTYVIACLFIGKHCLYNKSWQQLPRHKIAPLITFSLRHLHVWLTPCLVFLSMTSVIWIFQNFLPQSHSYLSILPILVHSSPLFHTSRDRCRRLVQGLNFRPLWPLWSSQSRDPWRWPSPWRPFNWMQLIVLRYGRISVEGADRGTLIVT